MAKTDRNGAGADPLEAYFSAARDQSIEADTDFLSRLAAEAEDAALARPTPRPALGLLRQLGEAIGGWPALTGLVTAGLAGLWIGFETPDGLAAPIEVFWTGAEMEAGATLFGSDYDTLLGES